MRIKEMSPQFVDRCTSPRLQDQQQDLSALHTGIEEGGIAVVIDANSNKKRPSGMGEVLRRTNDNRRSMKYRYKVL